MQEPTGRCFEDFYEGMLIQHELGRTIGTADNTWFTLITNNNNPIHFDHFYAAQTEFGQPLVNSTFNSGDHRGPQRRRCIQKWYQLGLERDQHSCPRLRR